MMCVLCVSCFAPAVARRWTLLHRLRTRVQNRRRTPDIQDIFDYVRNYLTLPISFRLVPWRWLLLCIVTDGFQRWRMWNKRWFTPASDSRWRSNFLGAFKSRHPRLNICSKRLTSRTKTTHRIRSFRIKLCERTWISVVGIFQLLRCDKFQDLQERETDKHKLFPAGWGCFQTNKKLLLLSANRNAEPSIEYN